LVSDIALRAPTDRAKDTLGQVYEYFLAEFASAEGKKGWAILHAIARSARARGKFWRLRGPRLRSVASAPVIQAHRSQTIRLGASPR
jgi:hypothetical protein